MAEGFKAADVSANQLPVIDVSGLSSSKVEARRAVAREMRAACTSNGFFYIANHGIPQGLIDAVQTQTRALFDRPISEKQKVAKTLSKCNRGWEPLGAQTLDPNAPPDLKETFYMGLEMPLDHPAVVAGKFNHGPNLWPQDMPGFKPTMNGYHAAMRDLSERIMVGLALSLDLAENYFDGFNRDPLSTLRLLHYPPHPWTLRMVRPAPARIQITVRLRCFFRTRTGVSRCAISATPGFTPRRSRAPSSSTSAMQSLAGPTIFIGRRCIAS